MTSREQRPTDRQLIDRILGYLNFSSGASEPQFLASLNLLFASVAGAGPAWREAVALLERELPRLSAQSATFADVSQACSVLRLLRDDVLPAYRAFHADCCFTRRRRRCSGRFCRSRVRGDPAAGCAVDETERIVQGPSRD